MGKRLFRFNGTFKVDVLDEEIEAESKEDAQRQLECWAEGRMNAIRTPPPGSGSGTRESSRSTSRGGT